MDLILYTWCGGKLRSDVDSTADGRGWKGSGYWYKLETMEGRRRGAVGGEGCVGKPSADTRGGGGGN